MSGATSLSSPRTTNGPEGPPIEDERIALRLFPPRARSLAVRRGILKAMEMCEYLTNGIRLFHVERIRSNGVVELEDCGIDRKFAVDQAQLKKMNLKHVEPLQKGAKGLGRYHS